MELRFFFSKGISIVALKRIPTINEHVLEIYIFFQFQMLMSAPTTLVIQMQHVLTLLDPSSVLVRKDLLEMVVTAQV